MLALSILVFDLRLHLFQYFIFAHKLDGFPLLVTFLGSNQVVGGADVGLGDAFEGFSPQGKSPSRTHQTGCEHREQ